VSVSTAIASLHAQPPAIGASGCAFAPAGVGNLAVGFDLIGMALDCQQTNGRDLGDCVRATIIDAPDVHVRSLSGLDLGLPRDDNNTATRAVRAMLQALNLRCGISLDINKGIPLGSGLGGSAASAVAAVCATNIALGNILPIADLYPFALEGECASSGAKHGDNVGPQLLGGVVFTNQSRCIALRGMPTLRCVVVHPDYVLETKRARAALSEPYPIAQFVQQSDYLASFLLALQLDDAELLRHALKDILVEPKRAALIPGFAQVKAAALAHDAIGASISGAGPSVFAWFSDAEQAQAAGQAMQQAFREAGLRCTAYQAPVHGRGARAVTALDYFAA
jgi:homoserine kinase